jgi:exodeoxyribonuclease V alpha subunit
MQTGNPREKKKGNARRHYEWVGATLGLMRGGVARWKRGISGSGVRSAVAYAMGGTCDATAAVPVNGVASVVAVEGVVAAARYAGSTVTRYAVTDAGIETDQLDADRLSTWFEGRDPDTGARRGRELSAPVSDLVLDATINASKTFSVAALLDADLAVAFDGLQDRLRDRVIGMWKDELNGRRGAGGVRREELARIEVVELKHERSRSLDPHKHRHLWLNTRVLGRDGEWSTVDSRVMFRFQTIVNAEGDLAARTDPQWLAALAAKGFTLNEEGEIAQLAAVVRPLSRRANQIEANRVMKLNQWCAENPGQEPGPAMLTGIDRWAWAHNRPAKPGQVDEEGWATTVRREIAEIDPTAVTGAARSAVLVPVREIADLDRDLLAAIAVRDADLRSAGNGGRFSMFDVRAGAVRAVAGSGVVTERIMLAELIEDVTVRAVSGAVVSLLAAEEGPVPGHVKGFMAAVTVRLKLSVAERLEQLVRPGIAVDQATVGQVAGQVLAAGRTLDAGQSAAAGAIAGTDRLVTVTGPAGTGKTTMLTVVRQMLAGQGRKLVIVAPTKKAASVAGRETGANASSLHALLYDYGFRWTDTATGQQWYRLRHGDTDRSTGGIWSGPVKHPLAAGDRIVVDEAGMVDLATADALLVIAVETGCGIAMVGDHLQALPVGHSGAMSLMRTRSSRVVELDAVHRFEDPAWAALSLRIREQESEADASEVAQQIVAGGHAILSANQGEARQHMVDGWLAARGRGESICLVVNTHEEAQTISEAIQQRRLETGQLNSGHSVTVKDGQVVYQGDIVQTRRNDTVSGVENRQTWTVHTVKADSVVLASTDDPGVHRTVELSYMSEHAHLAYATTVHGVQGETATRSIVGPGVDSAGLYVGLTRGRKHNEVVLIAGGASDARTQLQEMMRRGQIEATIGEGQRAAQVDLGRAARASAMQVVKAVWTDRGQRPLGRVMNLSRILEQEQAAEVNLSSKATVLADQIALDQRTLETVDERLATWDARTHSATLSGMPGPRGAPPTQPARDKLAARLDSRLTERAVVTADWRTASRRIRDAAAEQATRASQPAQFAEQEDQARLASLRQNSRNRHAQPTPGSEAPRPDRGLDMS